MVEDYIKAAKNPEAGCHYYDDRLRGILEETHGTIVYQEQIMQGFTMVMSGFSAGKSDKLRKAMGKKKLDVMRGLQADWDSGAVENGYSLEVAQQESGKMPRSSRSMRSTSRIPRHTPSWSCARLT